MDCWRKSVLAFPKFLGLLCSPCGAAVRALCAHGIAVFAQLRRLLWTLCFLSHHVLVQEPISIWEGRWCLLPGCWRAPMAVFAMVFGYAVCVLPFVLNNAWVAADNPYWHFLGLSFSPLRRGGTCAERTLNTLDRIWALMGASGLDFGGSLLPRAPVLENSSGSFRHVFWPCLWRVATDST